MNHREQPKGANQRPDADPELRYLALHAVMLELRNNPDDYDQGAWGELDCGTACCIANKLVAMTNPGREWYEKCKERTTKETGSQIWLQETIGAAATEVLGLKKPPKLFDPYWPKEWLIKAYESQEPEAEPLPPIEPSAEDAVMVICTIMDGELPEALEVSTLLHDTQN